MYTKGLFTLPDMCTTLIPYCRRSWKWVGNLVAFRIGLNWSVSASVGVNTCLRVHLRRANVNTIFGATQCKQSFKLSNKPSESDVAFALALIQYKCTSRYTKIRELKPGFSSGRR